MDDIDRMMRLFEGYHGAHGTHGAMTQSAAKGGKQEIKGSAMTVREPVTRELWQQHLEGTRPLGIITIREDSNCLWGCIDVDRYDLDLGTVVREIRKRRLPLVVCRTKSGGAHVFMFLSEPTPAGDVRDVLREISASMGWGDSEVFPKQVRVLQERGDLGNWLNMPYLGGDKTSRYGVKETGSGMSLSEFLSYAEERRSKIEEVDTPDEPTDETLNDGPPCLQHLSMMGFPEGTRNNGAFALGTFCKKKFGERWRDMLDKYNREFMKPPLSSEELSEVIKSLERKEYNYRCKDQPIVDFCNSALCKTRKFGVGGGGRYPSINSMSKLDAGDQTLWFVDIDDHRVELTTTQLLNYREFQRVAMDQLTIAFMPMRADAWIAQIGEAMASATIIEPPPELTTMGHFMELLEEFCTNMHAGRSRDDILMGKPWQDPEDGCYYFRLRDLMSFLERRKFDDWGRNVIGRRIEEKLGGRRFFVIKGKGTNTYFVRDVFQKAGPGDLPESQKEPI